MVARPRRDMFVAPVDGHVQTKAFRRLLALAYPRPCATAAVRADQGVRDVGVLELGLADARTVPCPKMPRTPAKNACS